MQAWNFSRNDAVALLAVVLVAICFVPTGAHLFELPHKMALPPAEYMTVQGIYAGWALFGIVVAAALIATAAYAWLVRTGRTAFTFALAGLFCLIATQVIFWSFTYPMNVASHNWTQMPEHFEAARRQWEYSHAASAGLTLLALIATTLSALGHRHEWPAPAPAE